MLSFINLGKSQDKQLKLDVKTASQSYPLNYKCISLRKFKTGYLNWKTEFAFLY